MVGVAVPIRGGATGRLSSMGDQSEPGDDAGISGWQRVAGPGLLLVASAALLGTATWAFFRWVVTDAGLLLDYMRVLVWPVVAVGVLIWLRDPVLEKFRDLQELRAMGVTGNFESQSAAALSFTLGDDIDAVSGTRRIRDLEDPEDDLHGKLAETVETRDAQTPTEPADRPPANPGTATPTTAEDDGRRELLRRLTSLVSPTPKVFKMTEEDPERAEAYLLNLLDTRLTRDEVRQRETEQERQNALESIVRKSADWGYAMGRAGAPRAVPDIEWLADGTWHITTEVPRQQAPTRFAKGVAESVSRLSNHERHINTLQDEIRQIERDRMKMGLAASLGPLVRHKDDDYLHELKRKLQRIDPGNPYAED